MTTRNIVPRADGEGSLGTSVKKWGAVHADDIYGNVTGDLTGNADTATNATNAINATNDGNGDEISTTYLPVSGVQTGSTNGTISVNGSDVAVKGLGSAAYTASTAYAAASHGNHVPAIQTANNKVFLRNDNTWQTVTPANIGAAASNHNHDSVYLKLAALPAGVVLAYAKSAVPTGWLLCDGSAVSRTTYAALFAVIGTLYGAGNGSTTFNLPNLTNRFIQGNGTAGSAKNAGLPNITGDIYSTVASFAGTVQGVGNGVFANSGNTNTSTAAARTAGNGTGSYYTINFNASKSNSIYGGSTTVQPPALTMRYIIKY